MSLAKYIKGAVATALGAVMLTSCASDYLDTPTHGSVPATEICKTPELARQAMLGVFGYGLSYAWLNTNVSLAPGQPLLQGETGFSIYMGEMPGSDDFVNFMYDEAPAWVIIYNMQEGYLSSGSYVWDTTFWTYAYSMIAQCNDILSVIDGCEVGTDAEKIAMRDFTKAQALTMRAHCYWRLLQVYAPRWVDSNNGEKLSVVLRLSPSDPTDKACAPMKDVLDQCYSDLNSAIDLFTAAGKSFRTLNYEIDKNVCYGVFARVAALKNDWETVRTMAHNARQGFRIATSQEIFNGYTSYNNNEWMWAPSFDQIDNVFYFNWCTYHTCNAYGALNSRMTSSINRDLYKLIPENDERANWWFTYEKVSLPASVFFQANAVSPETGALKNSRLLTAAKAWLSERKPANVVGDDAYANATTSDKSTSIIRDGAQVKFWGNGLLGEEGLSQLPYMRATEMYLYEAEACAELGMNTEAQKLLEEINKPRTNNEYTCSLTGQALIDEVRLYRRIELWGEGFCWFDLKRWNVPMHRSAWEAGKVGSGNIPAGLACDVPVGQNHGWRYGIPSIERSYNNLVNQPIPGETVDEPDVPEQDEE